MELAGGSLRLYLPKDPNPAPLLAANAGRFFKGKIAAGGANVLRIEIAGMPVANIAAAVAGFLAHCAAEGPVPGE